MYVRSWWQWSTIFISEKKAETAVTGCESVRHEKSDETAVAMYLLPPHSSFELRDDVSDAKSPRSTHATLRPRVAASSAVPQPVAPPPMTRMSNSAPLASAFTCFSRDGTPFRASDGRASATSSVSEFRRCSLAAASHSASLDSAAAS